MSALEAANQASPDVSPAAAAALMKEGDAAHARCKKLLPPSWAAVLKVERKACRTMKPVLKRHMQRSPHAWQGAMAQEARGEQVRLEELAKAEAGEGLRRCDGCGLRAAHVRQCACRLKRYCSRDCQRQDFPAHRVQCRAALGVA